MAKIRNIYGLSALPSTHAFWAKLSIFEMRKRAIFLKIMISKVKLCLGMFCFVFLVWEGHWDDYKLRSQAVSPHTPLEQAGACQAGCWNQQESFLTWKKKKKGKKQEWVPVHGLPAMLVVQGLCGGAGLGACSSPQCRVPGMHSFSPGSLRGRAPTAGLQEGSLALSR